ncbi:MAG: rRNA maturation RNase YbeY [Clostridiales bacterium]|nr:rRNA maturation RNase YbeY [Clostridiales bacterium]
MELVIDNRQDIIPVEKDLIELLEKVVKETLIYEGWDDDYEISLSLVNNEEIRELNKNYRNIDDITDVLSFPMIEEDEDFSIIPEKILGDIVISVEKAWDQAKEYGHSFYREMAFLTVHSMLHLMGYDHVDEDTEKEMQDKQEAILTKLKIKRV